MTAQIIQQFFHEASRTAGPDVPPEVLVAEANHRIANSLTMIAALARLQGAELAQSDRHVHSGEASAMLLEIGTRIETVGRLHRLLSKTPCGSAPELGPYLCDIALSAISSMSAPGAAPRFSAEIHDVAFLSSETLPLGFIVGELVTNSVKYAHPAGVAGDIRLCCARAADGATVVEVSDDGVGFPEGFDPNRGGGLGLRLVRSLASHLGADLDFDQTDLGLTTRLSIRPQHRAN